MMSSRRKCDIWAVCVLLCMLLLGAIILMSCSRGRKLPGPVPLDLGQTPQDQQPTDGKTGAGEIIFDPQEFNLSRAILDVTAARPAGDTRDSAFIASIQELLKVRYNDEVSPTMDYISLGVNAAETFTIDIDHDGDQDVLAGGSGANWREPTVSIVTQDGGTFEETETVLPQPTVTTIAALRVDSWDDELEILVSDGELGKIWVWFAPSGNLPARMKLYGARHEEEVITGSVQVDLLGEGREGVIYAIHHSTLMYMLLPYERSIQEPQPYADPRFESVGMHRLMALLVPDDWSATDDPAVLAMLAEETLVLSPYRITAGDFNDDDLVDLAVLGRAEEGLIDVEICESTYAADSFAVILVNTGAGLPQDCLWNAATLQQAEAIGPLGEDIEVADFDQDGNLDLVFSISGAQAIATMRGLGDGTFEDPEFTRIEGYHPYRIAIGYFDDGDMVDAVMTCPMEQSLIFFLNGCETATPPVG